MDNKNEKRNYWRILLWATQLLERYTHNTLDEKRQKQIEEWNPEDIPTRFNASENLLNEGCKRVSNKVFSELGFEQENKSSKRYRISTAYYKYAAVIALLIVTTFSTIYTLRKTDGIHQELAKSDMENLIFYTAEDTIRNVALPDGTHLRINKGSKVGYDENNFNKKNREVWLEGEAYFDVAKDPNRLFIIHNENLQTVVRGTSFSVKAYKELDEMSIAVRTGRVEIKDGNKLLAELTPNKQLLYTKSKKSAQESRINWEDASAWMSEKLVLRNAGMDELVLRIRLLYGKELMLDNHILENERLVISFEKGTSFTSVMDALCSLYDVKYKETSPDRVTIYR